jgi:uncharacterized membrane protein YvlD (DUF360 family)
MPLHKRLIQTTIIAIISAAALCLIAYFMPGLTITSVSAAILLTFVLVLVESAYWWLFISFFSWLPVWLYPIVTFVLTGIAVYVAGNFVPGITIDDIWTGIWIALWMTVVSAILAGIFSLDADEAFDRNVTRKLVARSGKPTQTDVPGFLFLEVDGLSEKLLRRAINEGHMPTLKKWLERGSHTITSWETDFTAQTGSMQPGILLGKNEGIPAYRWWDRRQGRMMMSGNPMDLAVLERQLSNGRGLLSDGGASRGNMYSGDAEESLFTFSTMVHRVQGRGPGFYAYIVSPYVIARLLTRFFAEVVREWWQAARQRRRKDKYQVSARNVPYAFFRALMGPLVQDLTTYIVIGDILRGVPAVYALYAGYDDVGHFAGMQTPEAFEVLAETDHYIKRVESALAYAPRPYHLIVLSDHGQSEGYTFETAYGVNLEQLVKGLIHRDEAVFAALDSQEVWDNFNIFVNESVNAGTRTAKLLRTALRSKMQPDGMVKVGPSQRDEQQQAQEAEIIVLASGCTGLIYFRGAPQRLTYEEIQARYPDLLPGLTKHPGIGWVLVRSAEHGDMVAGPKGIYFLDTDEVEGENPLAVYGPNAVLHLKREAGFEHCPDLLINTRYDPETEELCGFENQVSHHGGLGGPQNHAFIIHPVEFTSPAEPVIGAEQVYRLLRGWRDSVQGKSEEAAQRAETPAAAVTAS